MNRGLIDRIARAVLYEGYALYPYRPSSLKNSRRWMFGILYPPSWPGVRTGTDRSQFQMECLTTATDETVFSIVARFLHLRTRNENGAEWQDAVEREVALEAGMAEIRRATLRREFSFAGSGNGGFQEPVRGEITLDGAPEPGGASRLTLIVRNTATGHAERAEEALMRSLVSAHAAVSVAGGEFISMTDPPPELAAAASECVNAGVWPSLVGEEGARHTVLASPIILPDYPRIAPESAGDLYDATEIEEILTLRVLTMTDGEKAEARASEERARQIVERAESLTAERLMGLHGTVRGMAPAIKEPWSALDSWANAAPVDSVEVDGRALKAGDRVRLRPAGHGDVFDLALAGRVAVIAAIEQDFEDRVQLAVVIEDDPGRDLGEMRQTGHRFFFSPSEVEPVDGGAPEAGA